MLLKVKKICCLFIASLLILGIVSPGITVSANENRFFEVQEITGVAYIQPSGSMKSIRAAIGMKLYQGDRIQTEEYSSILLQTGDTKDNITIGEESDISIVHLQDKNGGKNTSLKAWKGSVYADVTPVKNKNDLFQIITGGTVFQAKGTHFIIVIDPITGLPTMVVGAGKVEVEEEEEPNENPVIVYPIQQILMGLAPNLPDGVSIVDLDSLIGNTPLSIIEALLRSKAQIDAENEELLNGLNPDDMDFGSEADLQRYLQNVDILLANLIKGLINSGQISPEEAARLIEIYNNNKFRSSSDFDMNVPPLSLSEEEKKRLEEIRQEEEKRKQEELERRQRELQEKSEELRKQLEEKLREQQEALRLAAEKAKKEAEEKMLAELAERERKELEERLRQKEKEKKEQEERSKQPIPAPAPGPTQPTPPGDEGGDDNSPIDPDPDIVAANRVIEKINNIPEPLTLESRELVTSARESYNALTDSQKELVTNIDKLIAFEQEIEKLLEIQDQIVTEIEENIALIDINNIWGTEFIISETRLMIDSLLLESADISEELLTYLEEAEVKLVEELISTALGDSYQMDKARKEFNQLSHVQQLAVSNKEDLYEMEVNLIIEMLVELSEVESISVQHFQQIDYLEQKYNQMDENQQEQIEEEKIKKLVAEKETLLLQDGNLDQYIDELSYGQNEQNIRFLYNIYEREDLTEEQREIIKSGLNMYIRERSIYRFDTEFLDYSNHHQVLFLSDGDKTVYIPLYARFDRLEELKDYVKNYIGDQSLEVNINEYDGLHVRPSIPNFYLLYKVLD